MAPFSNLISKSLLINDTISFLRSNGGSATAVNVVDHVMKIDRPEPRLAKLLAADLVMRDPRLALKEDRVEFIAADHNEINLRETSFVVFDLETTGSKCPPSRVIEIGAFRVEKGKVEDKFHSLINPEMPIPPFISSLTGISGDMVANAPVFADVAAEFLGFIGDSVLVAHNIGFDMSFLNFEIGRIFEDYRVGNPALCTVQLSRGLIPNIDNHKLNTVARYFSVDLINHHRAGDDAHATARIFCNLLTDLESLGIRDLAEAKRFSYRNGYVKRRRKAAAGKSARA